MHFDCVQDKFDGVEMGIIDTDDYAELSKRVITTIKENTRSLAHGTPHRRIPRLIVKRLVEVTTRNLNSFPAEDVISDENSPLSIATRTQPLDTRACSVNFGSYAEVFEYSD